MTPAMMLPKMVAQIKQNDPAKREARPIARGGGKSRHGNSVSLRTNLPGLVATLAGTNTEVKATNPKKTKIATTAK
jgi:hypothetical protein